MAGDGAGGDGGAWAIFVALAAMVVNLIVAIGGGIWALAHSRNSTDEKIATKEKAVGVDLADLERRMRDEISDSSRTFGETVAAIRQKVTETELWNRDNFVSKTTFQNVVSDMKRSWERFEDKLNTQLEQINKKLDRNNNEAN
jgi:Tfp pilus assembly protein PilX